MKRFLLMAIVISLLVNVQTVEPLESDKQIEFTKEDLERFEKFEIAGNDTYKIAFEARLSWLVTMSHKFLARALWIRVIVRSIWFDASFFAQNRFCRISMDLKKRFCLCVSRACLYLYSGSKVLQSQRTNALWCCEAPPRWQRLWVTLRGLPQDMT